MTDTRSLRTLHQRKPTELHLRSQRKTGPWCCRANLHIKHSVLVDPISPGEQTAGPGSLKFAEPHGLPTQARSPAFIRYTETKALVSKSVSVEIQKHSDLHKNQVAQLTQVLGKV